MAFQAHNGGSESLCQCLRKSQVSREEAEHRRQAAVAGQQRGGGPGPAPPQGQEERTGRGLKPRQAAGGQGGGAAPCQCLGSQGPAGRRWLGGQRRAWLGFDNHSSAKVAFPVGQEGLLVVSSNGSQSPHQDESV